MIFFENACSRRVVCEVVYFSLFVHDHDFRFVQKYKFDVSADYCLHFFQLKVGSIGRLHRLARPVCFYDFRHLFLMCKSYYGLTVITEFRF
nr:MAG TPA: hypothetical protein [Caudoviricetes sp.]